MHDHDEELLLLLLELELEFFLEVLLGILEEFASRFQQLLILLRQSKVLIVREAHTAILDIVDYKLFEEDFVDRVHIGFELLHGVFPGRELEVTNEVVAELERQIFILGPVVLAQLGDEGVLLGLLFDFELQQRLGLVDELEVGGQRGGEGLREQVDHLQPLRGDLEGEAV